ncbi:peptidoglycan-binding protein [Patescibacteria group bacterium]
MNKFISILIGASFLLAVILIPSSSQAVKPTTISAQETLQTIQQKIEELRAQIESLTVQLESLKGGDVEIKAKVKEIKTALRITKRLWRGMTNDDVELLQEILATDPEIYPEGLITGYFGPLTERAVKKFQKKMGVEQVGIVGPKTTAKINELLEEGAGSSGKVPPGLLIAPGIRKKIGYTPQVPSNQILPPGIAKKLGQPTTSTPTPDVVAPVISDLVATDTTATSTRITWVTNEEADSKIWYSTSTPVTMATSTPMAISTGLILNHDLALFSLDASTTYYYFVTSSDDESNTATSTEQSFITLSE